MPLQNEPFDPDDARPFFANLLPEAHVRTRIARGLGVSESNDFKLLEALGGDCVAKEHWLKLADDAKVGAKAVLAICEELGETVPASANKLAERFLPEYGGEEIIRSIIKHAEGMGKSMLERLKE